MRISRFFIAAPLFNDREREFNRAVRDVLSRHMRVYLPQEDCGLLPDLLRTGMAANAAEERIFQSDLSALDACEGVLAVLDGATIDEGVAFEIGYGFARGKV